MIAKKLKTKKEKEKNKEPGISKLKNEYEPKLFVKCCMIFPSFNKDDVEKIKRKKKTRRRKRTKENESALKKDYKGEEKRENVCVRRVEIVKKKKIVKDCPRRVPLHFPNGINN